MWTCNPDSRSILLISERKSESKNYIFISACFKLIHIQQLAYSLFHIYHSKMYEYHPKEVTCSYSSWSWSGLGQTEHGAEREVAQHHFFFSCMYEIHNDSNSFWVTDLHSFEERIKEDENKSPNLLTELIASLKKKVQSFTLIKSKTFISRILEYNNLLKSYVRETKLCNSLNRSLKSGEMCSARNVI